MAPRNEDVAVLGIVVIFGIEHVEITATVGIYKLFWIRTPRRLVRPREHYNQRIQVAICAWSRSPM